MLRCTHDGCGNSVGHSRTKGLFHHGLIIIPNEGTLCEDGHVSPPPSCTQCNEYSSRNDRCTNTNFSPGYPAKTGKIACGGVFYNAK